MSEPQWPTVPAMTGLGGDINQQWHVAINEYVLPLNKPGGRPKWDETRFMYDAKTDSQEVPRLAYLFKQERTGKLRKVHQQCSHSRPEAVPDNHLTCCLGVKCSECPHLKGLDAAKVSPEMRDWFKAWTRATHIISKGGDMAGEGYILTVDDRMYWDTVYSHLAANPDEL